MANLLISANILVSHEKVTNKLLFRFFGGTCLNPAVGIFLQMVAAFGAGDPLIFVRDVWFLIFPSILGAFLGAYFMMKIYEPLLLYIKYKDLADEA